MAYKALHVLQKKDIEVERDEFRKIPVYVGVLKKEDPSGHIMLEAGLAAEVSTNFHIAFCLLGYISFLSKDCNL